MVWRTIALSSGFAALVFATIAETQYVNPLQPFLSTLGVALAIIAAMAVVILASLDPERRARRYAEAKRFLTASSNSAFLTGFLVVFSLAQLLPLLVFGNPPGWVVVGIAMLAGLAMFAAAFRELGPRAADQGRHRPTA